jgi:hypothetical protein
VRLFARLFRLIWGADVDAALRLLLAVSFVGSAAFSAGWTFVGIWAIEELGASSQQLADERPAGGDASRRRVTPVAAGY